MSTDCSAGIVQPCVRRSEWSRRARLPWLLLVLLGVIWSPCASFAEFPTYGAPDMPVGATSGPFQAVVTITRAGKAATVEVVTQGAPNLDFKEFSTTCTINASYAVGQQCDVFWNFHPLSAGERLGAVVVKDSSNHVLGVSYLWGYGLAPLGLFSAPTPTWTVNGFNNPRGISVDGFGNVYVNDTGNQELREIPAGGGTPVTLASVPSYDGGATAVDGAGNIYVSANYGPNNPTNGIYELVGGSLVYLTALPGDNTPDDNLSVDATGNLYATDSNGGIYEIAAGTHAVTTLYAPDYIHRFIGMALSSVSYNPQSEYPSQISQLFVVDYNGSSLYELNAESSSLTLLASGSPMNNPHSIVLDPAGNMYVGNLSGASGILRYAAGTYAETTLPANGTASLAIDGYGNLYAVNGNSIVEYSRTTSPTESFPATANGTTSSASAPLVEFENDGNQDLVISSYAATSGFGVNGAGNTCATGTLASGATCFIGASFTPDVAEPNSGTLTLTDNSLNQSGAQQTVTLTGTDLQGSQTIDFTQPASPAIAGTWDNLSATGGASGNPVVFSATGPATINGDTITYTGAGTVMVTANQAGNADYSAALPVSRTVTVNAAPTSYAAPTEPVETASAVQTATVTFTNAGTLGSISVVTQGATGKDFNVAPGGSCTVGMAYAAGQVCTVNYTFTPLSPGTREGAVVLKDTSGNVLGTSYLGGVGTGPLGLFTTATQTLSISGLNEVRGLSLDGFGNLYGFDTSAGVVAKFAAGSTAETVLAYLPASGAGGATAVDGAGNLFVMDTAASALYEFVGASGPPITIASNIPASDDNLEVDGAGNLYYSGYGSSPVGAIYTIPAGTNQATQLVPGNLGHRFVAMAVDPAGNIFAPDYANNLLYELPAGSSTLVLLVSGGDLKQPHGVAVDPAGNIYVTNAGGNQVIRYAAGTYAETLLPAAGQRGVALDGAGNLYTITTDQSIAEFTRTQANPFTFANTMVGTSSDSQQGVVFENDGNTDLAITAYSATSPFALNGSQNTCAVGTLASGASCVVGASFSPMNVGPYSGTATITDNTLGVAGTAQTIALSGTAIQGTQTITFTAPPTPVTYGIAPITLTATGGASGNPVTFSVLSGPGSISGNLLTVTGAGSIVIAANQAGDANYTAAPQVTQTVYVYPALVVTAGAAPSTICVGSSTLLNASLSGGSGNYTNVVWQTGSTVVGNGTSLSVSPTVTTTYTVTGTDSLGDQARSRVSVTVNSAPNVYFAGQSPSTGLLHWWQANNNANDSVGSSNGTLVGSVGYAPGGGFSLNGGGYVAFGSSAAVVGTGPFSVTATIETNSSSQQIIMQQRDAGYNGQYSLGIGGTFPPSGASNPGHVCWSIYGSGQYSINFCSNQAVDDGKPHLITATRESDGSGRIYIDGVLDNSQSAVALPLIQLGVYVGADVRDNDHYFNGVISNISIWTPPTSITYGSSLTLTPTVTGGTGSYSYRWTRNGSPVAGGATLTDTPPAVGTYAYTVTVNDADGCTPGTATFMVNVTPATLTAAIVGNPTRRYNGSAAATLAPANFQLSGLLGSDSFAVTQTAGTYDSANAGTHAVTASLASADFTVVSGSLSNYVLPTSATGAGTISPAAASVTPNAASKIYGTADPALTGALTGFLPADNVTATYTRAAGETVLGGPYAISATLAPAAVLSNYNITYDTAPFTITPATAAVNFGNVVQTYTSGPLAPTVTTVPAGVSYSVTGAPDIAAGSYSVAATITDPNYVGSGSTAFTILQAPAAIALSNLAQVYSGNPEPATATVTPAYCGPAAITYNGAAASPSNIGTYLVVATLVNPNCTAPNTAGTLIINAFAASSCVYALNPTAHSAFSVSDGSSVTAQCSIQVNSSARDAFDVDGHGTTVNATAISVVGGAAVDRGTNVSNAPSTGQTSAADPLAAVVAPTVGTCINAGNHGWDGDRDDGYGPGTRAITLNPGTYCGGIAIHARSTITFNPGTYILLGGGLTIDGGAQVMGTGVTFYNTADRMHPYQPIHIDGGSKTTLSAPLSGPLAGVLFFQDRNLAQRMDPDHDGDNDGSMWAQPNVITGNTESTFAGALYFPTTALVYSGGADQDPAAYTLIVADTISVSAQSNVSLTVLGKPMIDNDSDSCSPGPGKDCDHDKDGDHK